MTVAGMLPSVKPPILSYFELAVCSHLLFFYADTLSLSFHHQAIAELCRVAHEVRIFPLPTYDAEPCPFVDSVTARLKQTGHMVSIEPVPYEFQRGGNKMLRVSRQTGG
jgi:hypothetical protein